MFWKHRVSSHPKKSLHAVAKLYQSSERKRIVLQNLLPMLKHFADVLQLYLHFRVLQRKERLVFQIFCWCWNILNLFCQSLLCLHFRVPQGKQIKYIVLQKQIDTNSPFFCTSYSVVRPVQNNQTGKIKVKVHHSYKRSIETVQKRLIGLASCGLGCVQHTYRYAPIDTTVWVGMKSTPILAATLELSTENTLSEAVRKLSEFSPSFKSIWCCFLQNSLTSVMLTIHSVPYRLSIWNEGVLVKWRCD